MAGGVRVGRRPGRGRPARGRGRRRTGRAATRRSSRAGRAGSSAVGPRADARSRARGRGLSARPVRPARRRRRHRHARAWSTRTPTCCSPAPARASWSCASAAPATSRSWPPAAASCRRSRRRAPRPPTSCWPTAGAGSTRCSATASTTIEAKSGYGLDLETEIRLLEVAYRLGARARSTSCRRTSAPTPSRRSSARGPDGTEAYVRSIIEEQLPGVAAHGRARFCDVFCEEGVFSADQSRRILEAAAGYGMAPAAARRRARPVRRRGARRRARGGVRRPPRDAVRGRASTPSPRPPRRPAGRRDGPAGHDLVPDEGPRGAGPDVHRARRPGRDRHGLQSGHVADRRACRWR